MDIETIRVSDRATWLQLRSQDLTASDIPAVAGLDDNRSALSVYAEKTGMIPGSADNKLMRRGRWLEPAVIEALKEERPAWKIKRAGVYLRDPEIRMGATPDGIATDPDREGIGNVQCKVVSRPIYERDWEDGAAPLKFQIQTLAEAMLLGAEWSVVAALVIDTFSADLVIHEVERHDGAENRIREIVREFWANVAAGKQPAPDPEKDQELIPLLYRNVTPGKVKDLAADNAIRELLERLTDEKAAAKLLTDSTKKIEAAIKAKLQDAEEGQIEGWKITWREQSRREFVTPATRFRVLRIVDKRSPGDEEPF